MSYRDKWNKYKKEVLKESKEDQLDEMYPVSSYGDDYGFRDYEPPKRKKKVRGVPKQKRSAKKIIDPKTQKPVKKAAKPQAAQARATAAPAEGQATAVSKELVGKADTLLRTLKRFNGSQIQRQNLGQLAADILSMVQKMNRE